MRKVLLVVTTLMVAMLGPGPGGLGSASAHALLKAAVPAVGATVGEGPQDLRLRFSEGVEAAFSGVDITTEDGRPVGPVTITVEPAVAATLIVTLPAPLAPGTYTVQWHVVSVDTHKTRGRYGFTVKP